MGVCGGPRTHTLALNFYFFHFFEYFRYRSIPESHTVGPTEREITTVFSPWSTYTVDPLLRTVQHQSEKITGIRTTEQA